MILRSKKCYSDELYLISNRWSAPEVAMWMEQVGFGEFAPKAVDNGIEGHKLLSLTKADLPLLNIILSADQKKFMSLVKVKRP